MLYPNVARIDCNDCKKYSYNLRTGKRNTYEAGEDKVLPVLRSADPPCGSCPKKSPKNGERLRLRPENQLMLDFYQRAKAVPSMRSKLLDCPVTQRNFKMIEQTFDLAKAKMAMRARRRAERKAANGRLD